MSFGDIEANSIAQQKISMANEKVIKILCIGDKGSGKTHFLRNLCHLEDADFDFSKKPKKTVGCKIHVKKHFSKKDQSASEASKALRRDQFVIEFWDIAGDRKSSRFMNT